MIVPPKELLNYISYKDGKIIAVNLPKELEETFIEFKKEVESIQKENSMADL